MRSIPARKRRPTQLESLRCSRLYKALGQAIKAQAISQGTLAEPAWATAITDALTDIRHICDSVDVELYPGLDSSYVHYREERHVPCAKCGAAVSFGDAINDAGSGPEAGRVFSYCSQACLEGH